MGAKLRGPDPPLKRNVQFRCPPTAWRLPLLWGDFGTSPGISRQGYTTLPCGGKGALGWQLLLFLDETGRHFPRSRRDSRATATNAAKVA
jgi:hypothetical protein